MQLILGVGDSSYFTIDGIPYQRGQLIPVYDVANGKVSFRDQQSMRNDKFSNLLYSDYIDASTGNPFASWSALMTWIAANVFAGTISGSSTTGLAFMRTFYIVAAPAADDEKAAGATFTDPWLDGIVPQVMLVNGEAYTGAFINYDDGTDTIGIADGNFVVGDVVVILKS